VPLPRIAGHRDGDSTDCPGNGLYGELPGIRGGVRRLAPRPVRATLALGPPAPAAVPPAPTTPGAPAAGQARTLTGTVSLLDGTPLAGARVVVQSRAVSRRGEAVSERTLGEAQTDAAGRWALSAVLAPGGRGSSLRALFAGSSGLGAALSEPLELSGPLELSPPPSAPPPIAPQPSPPAAAPPAT
jgi:hypothetical protein